MKKYLSVFLLSFFLTLVADFAVAKDISAAASTAQAQITKIGMSAVGIGITIGGLLFAIGLGGVGRFVITSGLTGAAVILGLQGILSLMRMIFS